MKKIISLVLVCVLLVGCVFALASCARTLNGTYELGSGVLGASYTFKGSNVTITIKALGTETELEGTYTITTNDDGEDILTITLTGDDAEADEAEDYTTPMVLIEGTEGDKKYIKLNGVPYYKAED